MTAYVEGEWAYFEGHRLSDNPYDPQDSGFTNWRSGWFYARWESTEE